jgi:hypothetical protein
VARHYYCYHYQLSSPFLTSSLVSERVQAQELCYIHAEGLWGSVDYAVFTVLIIGVHMVYSWSILRQIKGCALITSSFSLSLIKLDLF